MANSSPSEALGEVREGRWGFLAGNHISNVNQGDADLGRRRDTMLDTFRHIGERIAVPLIMSKWPQ